MTCDLVALCIDANDPRRVAEFWAGVLGWEVDDSGDVIGLLPADDTGFASASPARSSRRSARTSSTSTSRARRRRSSRRRWRGRSSLGGRHHRRRPAARGGARGARRPRGQRVLRHRGRQRLPRRLRVHRRAVGRRLAGGRPLLERGARLAAGLGPGRGDRDPVAPRRPEGHLGRAAAGTEGRQGTGAPRTWRRRPMATSRPRSSGSLALGATRVDLGQGGADWVVLADPDGNEFCVLPAGSPG